MELPKLFQHHSEKENRSIEVQINEAKEILATILLAISVLTVLLAVLLMGISIKEGIGITNEIFQIILCIALIRCFVITAFYRRP